MSSRNYNGESNGKKGVWWAVIIFVMLGFMVSPVFYAVAVIVFFIGAFSKNDSKENNTDRRYGNVNNSVNRSMTSNYGSAQYKSNAYRNTKYTAISEKNSLYDLDGNNPNSCPICGTISAAGYCNKCGYRFKRYNVSI